MFHLKAVLVVRQIAAVNPAIGVISGQQDVGHHFNNSAVILMAYAWDLCKHHSGPHKIGYHNHCCIHKVIHFSDVCPTKGGITDNDMGWGLGVVEGVHLWAWPQSQKVTYSGTKVKYTGLKSDVRRAENDARASLQHRSVIITYIYPASNNFEEAGIWHEGRHVTTYPPW